MDDSPLHRITVGFDGAERSEPAVQVALELHRTLGWDVHVLHVSDVRQHSDGTGGRTVYGELTRLWEEHAGAIRERARKRLRELLEAAGTDDLQVDAILEFDVGKPAHVLARHAHDKRADLFVLGPHEQRGRLDFGSTARAVMAAGSGDIWVQPGPFEPIHSILVPTDLSEHSLRALRLALQLAEGMGAAVTVLHCYVPPTFSYSMEAVEAEAATLEEVIEADRGRDREDFERLLTKVDFGDVAYASLWLEGLPGEVIGKQGEEHDLVVLGTHGRTGLSATLLGNVAYGVLRRSLVPVLAVRLPTRRWLLGSSGESG